MGVRRVHGGRGNRCGVSVVMRSHGTHAHGAAGVHAYGGHAHRRQRGHGEVWAVRIDALQRLHAASVAHGADGAAHGADGAGRAALAV